MDTYNLDNILLTNHSFATNLSKQISLEFYNNNNNNYSDFSFLHILTSQSKIDNYNNKNINITTGLSSSLSSFNAIEAWGPQRDSLLIVIPITIIYSIIFITGVIGNISTCIVIKKNRSMHTATNYYLFSLAISDFLLLLSGVPQEVYYVWCKYPYVLGETFCVGRGLLAETSANATVLTITAFTVERYVAICHPFMAHAMSKLNRATRIILMIWFTSFLTAIPQAAQFGVHNFNGYDRCDVVRIIIEHSFQLSTFIFFFAPMSIILILYLLIGLKLHQTSVMRSTSGNILYRASNNSGGMRTQTHQGTKRVLKMLVAVVIAFFICWAPFHAQRLIAVYGAEEYFREKNPIIQLSYNILTYLSGVLYYLSTCINPLLYNIMSNKFREAFKETLDQWNIFSSKANKPKQKYNVLSRTKRLRVAFQESNDYTSSSQREESFQSTSSSWKNHDSITRSKSLICDNINNSKSISDTNSENVVNKITSATLNKNDELENYDSIIKIDHIDLPSKDVSLNVFYTREGDIQIRLLKKPKRNQKIRNLFSFFSNALKTKSSSTKHMGFYTPPVDDNISLHSLNLYTTSASATTSTKISQYLNDESIYYESRKK